MQKTRMFAIALLLVPLLFAGECRKILEVEKGATAVPAVAPPIAGFRVVVLGLAIDVTDESQNFPTAWEWDFGDGSAFVHQSSPIHTYAAPGVYTVVLEACNDGGCDSDSAIVTLE